MENNKKTIETIGYNFTLDTDFCGNRFSNSEKDYFIKRECARALSDFILENFDKLPIEYEIKIDSYRPSIEEHKFRVILISKEELIRLQEYDYY